MPSPAFGALTQMQFLRTPDPPVEEGSLQRCHPRPETRPDRRRGGASWWVIGGIRLGPGHTDLVEAVDRDLLDRRVIQQRLEEPSVVSDGRPLGLGERSRVICQLLVWQLVEQLGAANKGIVIPSDAPPGSAPLQAVTLNQVVSGPSRWMPADVPGQARSTTATDR
jgi:hypothetical protein